MSMQPLLVELGTEELPVKALPGLAQALFDGIIDGLSKQEFIKSKTLTVVLFAVASTAFIFIMSLILGYCFSSYTETSIVFSGLEYIGGFFLNMLIFFSFCLFAGMLIKRSAFAIGFIFLWYVVEWIVAGLLRFVILNDGPMTNRVMGFFPLEAMHNLVKEPFTRFQAYRAVEAQMSGSENFKYYGIHWYEVIIGLAWAAIFIYLSYRILKNRDL